MAKPVVVVDELNGAQDEEPIVVSATPTTKSAKVKGTWTMFYGTSRYDFIDGQRYNLPMDLFNYLKAHGNIYDTL